MKRSVLFFLILAICLPYISNAQTSKDILDKLSSKAKTWKTISADFTSTLTDKKNNKTTKQEGSVKVKGQKYFLNLPDFIVISDAKSVWSYDKKGNMCSIDNLEDMKDGSFDPSEMFTIWEKDFKHEMKNTSATVDGVGVYEINLYPNDPQKKPYHTITMYVDKAKIEVIKIVVKTRENTEISYKVKNLKTNVDYPDSDFTFDKAKHPGVEMTDNRW
ncbi:MAG: outer membrane lipoprotein carrier protein LolA [Crocinitomicaceae bacterium]|nr:outer membrane lipoprotein carrier protein LolA [Crocinitomicaceae bacterium]